MLNKRRLISFVGNRLYIEVFDVYVEDPLFKVLASKKIEIEIK